MLMQSILTISPRYVFSHWLIEYEGLFGAIVGQSSSFVFLLLSP